MSRELPGLARLVVALPFAFGCATTNVPAGEVSGARALAVTPVGGVKAAREERTYTDPDYGFQVERPDGWGFAPRVAAPDGGSIPLVIAQPDKGAQVIVQVAPRVASAQEISGDLRNKLDEHPGIQAGKSEAVKSGQDPAYGFGFTAEGARAGRVAVVEGGDRLFVIIGSWPQGADEKLKGEVNGIFDSLHKTAASSAAKKKGGM